MTTDAAVLLELRLMRQRLDEVDANVATLLRLLLQRKDRRLGIALLPLVAELVGAAPFTAATLAAAALAARTPLHEAVRQLIAEACGDGPNVNPLGTLLARLEGVPLGGCRLVAAGTLHGVRRWRLVPAVGGDGAD